MGYRNGDIPETDDELYRSIKKRGSRCTYCGATTYLSVRKLRNDFSACSSPKSVTGWHKWESAR